MHYKFNVAFVQIQLVTLVQGLPENKRSTEQLEKAAEGLESAITSLDEIAAHPQTPYPKNDVEQRANMARNTLRNQLQRAIGKQKEWEEKNKEKIQAAKELREAEVRRREEERQKIVELERERQEKIKKERDEIAKKDRALAAQRAEEEQARMEAEMTTDSETGDKVKRKRKTAPRASGEPKPKRSGGGKKKKKSEHQDDESEEEEERTKKRRRLTKKESAKFKSAEIVVDSDEENNNDDDELERAERNIDREETPLSEIDEKVVEDDKMDVDGGAEQGGDDDDEEEIAPRQQNKRARRGRVVSDEEDNDDEEAPTQAKTASGDEDDEPRPAADTSMADAADDEE